MHERANHQSPRLWLIAGTGDGLALALAMQRRGWRLLVSVVSQEAARAYPPLPGLELRVGPVGGASGIHGLLLEASQQNDPFAAVVDASHPFARQITAALAQVWQAGAEGNDPATQPAQLPPLLRLRRPHPSSLAVSRLRLLPDLAALGAMPLHGRRVLLAIGARQLGEAVRHSPGAVHHARLLPSAAALQQGRAAGIAAERLACLRPGDPQEPPVLRALLRRWQIDTILCRQSGGITETLWRQLAAERDLELVLLRRPAEPEGLRHLELDRLVRELEALHRAAPTPSSDVQA